MNYLAIAIICLFIAAWGIYVLLTDMFKKKEVPVMPAESIPLNDLGNLFNDYVNAFGAKTRECDRDFDIDCGKIRIRLFGSNERKNAAWREAHPGSGDTIYFMSVSTNPVEIWGDVREVTGGEHGGQLVINTLSLGHELIHALRIIQAKWTLKNEGEGEPMSPDKYIDL